MMRKDKKQIIECSICHKKVTQGNITTHQKTKKCKNHNDKTAGRNNSPALTEAKKPLPPNNEKASVPAESHSKILTEINLKGEFETMIEKINSKVKDEDKKYEHACGARFNEKLKFCPGCGDELEV